MLTRGARGQQEEESGVAPTLFMEQGREGSGSGDADVENSPLGQRWMVRLYWECLRLPLAPEKITATDSFLGCGLP